MATLLCSEPVRGGTLRWWSYFYTLELRGTYRILAEGAAYTGQLLAAMLPSARHSCIRDCQPIARTLEGELHVHVQQTM